MPLRRSIAYGRRAAIIDILPEAMKRRLELDGNRVNPLRVELGCGPFPTAGYIHVDIDRRARHLEHVAPVWELPFENESLSEVLAVHVFEHVHPSMVQQTLREWCRVLQPGGHVQVHVPNATTSFKAYLEGSSSQKWAMIGYLYGMYCGPEVSRPSELFQPADHKAVYDFDLIRSLLCGWLLVDPRSVGQHGGSPLH